MRDPRWARVLARDAAADGAFFYSVATTGVFCRPSCGARPARPENVDFHANAADAERAGFRPCMRCKPTSPPLEERQAETVAELCRFIEGCEHAPSLEELASNAGLSPSHTHRLFRRITGVTPAAYASSHRARRVRGALRNANTVTEAIFDAGYGSSARFYEKSSQLLGMTPTEYRAGAKSLRVRFAIGECSLGVILVAATEKGVCAISLGADAEKLANELESRFPGAELVSDDAAFARLVARVIAIVEGGRADAKLPLDIRGTVFQQRVWEALRTIPAGSTATYAEIAAKVGAPRSHRAVAKACASNVLAVVIPCHRVVRSDGGVSGYRWGVARKRALLAREGRK